LNDIEDVERHLPGLIRATNEWFRFVVTFGFAFRTTADVLPLFLVASTRSVRIRRTFSALLLFLSLSLADGKPENAFAFSGEAKNKKYATEIVHECHEAWRRLVHGEANPSGNSLCV